MNMSGAVTAGRMSVVSVDIIEGLQCVFVGGGIIQIQIWIWRIEITDFFPKEVVGNGG